MYSDLPLIYLELQEEWLNCFYEWVEVDDNYPVYLKIIKIGQEMKECLTLT